MKYYTARGSVGGDNEANVVRYYIQLINSEKSSCTADLSLQEIKETSCKVIKETRSYRITCHTEEIARNSSTLDNVVQYKV